MGYYKILSLALLLISNFAMAQGTEVEMADVMRSNGKIYVVVAVLVLILAGVLFYLINTERRLGKLEKELEDKK